MWWNTALDLLGRVWCELEPDSLFCDTLHLFATANFNSRPKGLRNTVSNCSSGYLRVESLCFHAVLNTDATISQWSVGDEQVKAKYKLGLCGSPAALALE